MLRASDTTDMEGNVAKNAELTHAAGSVKHASQGAGHTTSNCIDKGLEGPCPTPSQTNKHFS